jgi:hypothetical protein
MVYVAMINPPIKKVSIAIVQLLTGWRTVRHSTIAIETPPK